MNMLSKENFSETDKNTYNENLQKEEPFVIPVIEETASIDKQVVQTGKIRIEKQVQEINEATAVNLLHDEYTIKRVAINKYVDDAAPQVRQEGNILIIPVVKEVMVKRLLLVEEVQIIKETVTTTEQVNVPLRKETVTVLRSTDNTEPPAQS